MTHDHAPLAVFIETGTKRTVASAVDWPGWCRVGRDEPSALQALLDYGPRFAHVLNSAQIAFQPPTDQAVCTVVEQLVGNATTDFGTPGVIATHDLQPFDEAELQRAQALLTAAWQAFDRTTKAAVGRPLRAGPRGGGRDVAGMLHHVREAAAAYLARLAWKLERRDHESIDEALERTHHAMLDALKAAAHGGLPTKGPRGGSIWPPRYFVRRAAWHVLDHTWEIEDRLI